MKDLATLLARASGKRWGICLSTHLGTPIPNETNEPISMTGGRLAREQKFKQDYTPSREPTSGYNCVGQALASRRTIVDPHEVDKILVEDGYVQLKLSVTRPGDVVIYSDDQGPCHVCMVVRVEGALSDSGELMWNPDSAKVTVLSKFDDCSGEYEHALNDISWNQWRVTPKLYRARCAPATRHGASLISIP